MNQNYEYFCLCLELKDGPVYVDFDFIPEEPTYKQLRAFMAHTCESCAYSETRSDVRPGCNPDLCAGKGCRFWAPHWDSEIDAEKQYWLDLHRRTMKGKPVPHGRNAYNREHCQFVTYSEDE